MQTTHKMSYSAELLKGLKSVYTLGKIFREGGSWNGQITEHQSIESVVALVPWFSALLQSRVAPIWIAENVDGVASLAKVLDLPLPPGACSLTAEFQALHSSAPWVPPIDLELQAGRSLGVYIPPKSIPTFLDWLNTYGAQMLREAAAHGESQAMRLLLKKIKECAVYAQKNRCGYLETTGIEPSHWAPLKAL